MSILDILNEIESVPGKLDKLSILKKNKDNELLKNVFYFTLSPFITFGIKQIPEVYVHLGTKKLEWGLEGIYLISNKVVTGHKARDQLQDILTQLGDDDAEVIRRIIQRDLKCGASKGSAEKTWKGLIPKIPCMLAQPMKDKFISKIKFPAIAQLKSDGARCVTIVSGDDDIALYSRNCKEYHGLEHIKTQLTSFVQKYGPCAVDGELVVLDDNGNILPRKVGNGIINKCTKETITADEAQNVQYVVWDIIPLKDYWAGICKTPYKTRLQILENLKNLVEDNVSGNISVIETHLVNSLEEAKEVFRKYVAEGEEGILLKNLKGQWADKRSNDQVKFKQEIHSDFICTGVIEGINKYEGKLGAISLESKCGRLKVNCGSGFNDEQREYYWNNKEEIIGTVVEVKHNGVIDSDSKETYSVFLPIFQYIREDKNVDDADTLETSNG